MAHEGIAPQGARGQESVKARAQTMVDIFAGARCPLGNARYALQVMFGEMQGMETDLSQVIHARDLARQQLQFARSYTDTLLADIAAQDWFTIPSGSNTHLAWQVGHMAMAQYGLTLLRIRGKLPSDSIFIDNDFMRAFKKGSVPVADAASYPAMDRMLETFRQVFREALSAIPLYEPQQLLEPVEMPFAVYPNKLGSILFCAAHEMLHAGQIGMLRRQLGKPPVR
jgi:DinB superfamily